MATNLKPDISRGTDYPLDYYHQIGGVQYDGDIEVFFTVKTPESDTSADDTTAIILKTVSGTNGYADLSLTPVETAYNQGTTTFITPGKYKYDIVVEEVLSGRQKMVEGSVKIDGSPTNRGL